MKQVLLSHTSLALAMGAASGDDEPPASDSQWTELIDIGVAEAPHHLHPAWAEALQARAAAPVVHHLAAEYNGLAMLNDVFFSGDYTVSVVRRQRVDGDTGAIVGTDPKVTLIVAAGDAVWECAHATLPPLPQFQAPPQQVPAEREALVEIDPALVESLQARLSADSSISAAQALHQIGPLPAELIDVEHPIARLTLATEVRDNNQASAPGFALVLWFLGEQGFYRLASGDRPGLFRTEPGDVGFRLTWITMGAVDALTAAGDRR
jgi:hypothetical protein